MPKLSVVMSCYNAENFVSETIQSILNQTFTDFEFLICDDCSTDNSLNIIKQFKDPRIILFENKCNMGVQKTTNKLMLLTKGEYIAKVDADDISLKNRFKKQVEFLDKHLDVGLCGSWIDFFTCKERQGDGCHPYEIKYEDLLKGWCVNQPTVMFRKSVLVNNNLQYDENFPVAEDYELWSRLIRYTKIINLPEFLVKYRWHTTNLSITKQKDMEEKCIIIKNNMLDYLTSNEYCKESIRKICKEKNGIPVFLSIDDNFVAQLLVTMISIMEHTKSFVDFYILDNGISKENKKIVYTVMARYYCSLDFVEVKKELLFSLPIPETYVSMATYARLFIPMLKPHLDKVIYTDCDVVFKGDILSIYNSNLNGKIIGVVPDVFYRFNKNANSVIDRLNLSKKHEYFYAGLILIDAKKWRYEERTKRLLNIAELYGKKIKQADQDLLNICFDSDFEKLSSSFEVTNLFIEYRERLSKKERKLIDHPLIRHYESAYKPWNSRFFGNKKMNDFYLWWKYAKKTPFYKQLKRNFKKNNGL